MSDTLKSPFPWFGGKSRVADIVWERFGNVPNYCEPFFGSGAVLLGRPHEPGIETINDKDCMVANFWRALQNDPVGVAAYADSPVNEADLHARHLWLCSQAEFRESMKTEPDYFDSKIAGWWVWGQCIWIGSGWCSVQLPHLGDAGRGVHRQLPHLGDAGRGALEKYLSGLADRLRRVRVCCGDWSRICGPTPTIIQGVTGVFLDPPYNDDAGRSESLYASEDLNVSRDVLKWCLELGDHKDMRIALCGYDGEHDLPDTWDCVAWKAHGGYGSQSNGQARLNSHKERIWFSPHCLKPDLFSFQNSNAAHPFSPA